MGCLALAGCFFVPRFLLFFLWVVDFFDKVQPWETRFLPILGFLFMPATTLAYGLAHILNEGKFGLWWTLFMTICVIVDASSLFSSINGKK